jgi:tripartite ATP-independent transporter DctM subunit
MTLLGVLVAGLLLRAPIAFSMISAGIAYLMVKGQDLGSAAEQILNGIYNSYVLLAVPLFIFAANLMNAGSISERLFAFARVLVGRLRGGLAQVDIMVSVIFSGMSGSAIADAAGPGLVTIKAMMNKPGYTPGFAGAIVVASAIIGPIIPPSIPMVLYAMSSNASVGALFLGGVIPGLLMAALMMVVVYIIAVRRDIPRDDPIPKGEIAGMIRRGLLPLSLPVVMLGGIYTGVFTPTEAAAVAALHALLLAGIVYRAFKPMELFAVVLESSRATAMVAMMVAASYIIQFAFTAEGIPQLLSQWVGNLGLQPGMFLLIVNLVFLVLGCFLDVGVLLLVFVPMLIPTVTMLGIDLVHFGVLIVINIMIGLTTPPFGMLLFVTSSLIGIRIREMVKEGLPFLAVSILALMLITYVPSIVLWLPQSMGYGLGK